MAKQVSTEEFEKAAETFIDELSAQDILNVPGVRMLVQDRYNNEIIEAALLAREEA